jgi:uncharacterized protein YxjI
MSNGLDLMNNQKFSIKQIHEIAEWIGFESRNKYQITNEKNHIIAYAAEQQKGFWGFLFRQALGHLRTFDVLFFDNSRNIIVRAHHPFRWYFERIEVYDEKNVLIGAIQKRFSIFNKRFDIEDERKNILMEMSSPLWKIWTFTFTYRNQKMAEIKKKWSGLLSEILTDRDNFQVEYLNSNLKENEKMLILVSSIFIDLLYFEHKQ